MQKTCKFISDYKNYQIDELQHFGEKQKLAIETETPTNKKHKSL